MRSIFDNLQNTPFGDLTKEVLNTDVLKRNVLNELHMPQTGGKYKNYEELSFKTFNNYYELKRYYQALKYGMNDKGEEAYGMECNAVTLMYFLQSLGLIPPEMRRKEFEYAFTTLSPYEDKQSIQKQKEITINGTKPMEVSTIDNRIIQKPLNLKPKNLIEAQYLSENALLGGKFGISLINQTLETALLKLEKITKSFAEFPYQTQQKGNYDFLKSFHRSIVMDKIINQNGFIKNLQSKLQSDDYLNDTYFESGKTIFISVSYALSYGEKGYNGLTGHYALIVGKQIDSFIHEGKKYYIYPADDALWGRVYILVPTFKDVTSKFNHPKILGATYDGTYLHNITNLAIGLD